MHRLVALPVVIPLVAAAAIVITGRAPRRFHDVIATAAAAATATLCALVLAHTRERPLIEWLGGWRPHHRVALGVALAPDQLGAGAALLASVLVVAALVYSWKYFDRLDGLVHALILVLAAAMIGFCISGDLFTMIVFFVLMTVPAIGLTAIETEHRGPLQGAINFGVVNSVAGFAAFVAAGLVYGRSGALNLAQISLSLSQHRADALVAVAFGLVVVAFLTKAGAAPFHFWLPDAHAVAPAPVAGLFSGAMVAVSLFGVARVVTTAFAHPLAPHAASVRTVFVIVGALTALVCAFAAFEQRHIKRLLAFATAQQIGVMLCGIGLFRNDGLAGAALVAIGSGLTLSALFGAAGLLLRRHSATDEFHLYGLGRDLQPTALVFLLGGLTFASLPPTATFFGTGLVTDAARPAGFWWLPIAIAVSGAVTAGAMLRVSARVFLGWGTREERDDHDRAEQESLEQSSGEEEQDASRRGGPSLLLRIVPLVLLAAAVVIAVVPGFVPSVQTAAAHFRDVRSYVAIVLDGAAPQYGLAVTHSISASAWLYAGASLLGAVAVAAAGLRGRRILPVFAIDGLRAAHSGHVGDYVAWWTFGAAVIGGALLWAIAG